MPIGRLYEKRESDGNMGTQLDAFLRGLDTPKIKLPEFGSPPELKLGKPTGQVTTEGRRLFRNSLGGVSSELSITIQDQRVNSGKSTNIPSIFSGRIRTVREATDIIAKSGGIDPETGRTLPGFGSQAEALAAAKKRSANIRIGMNARLFESTPHPKSPVTGIRTHNPLNIEIGEPWIGRAQRKLDSRFETFKSPVWGIRAGAMLLRNYQLGLAGPTKTSQRTLRQVISTFAPPSENALDSYTAFVANDTGIDPDTEIDLVNDPNMLREVLKAMTKFETNQTFSDEVFDSAISAIDDQALGF